MKLLKRILIIAGIALGMLTILIGLDMAVPSAYDDFDFAKVEQRMKLGALSVKLGAKDG